MKLIEQNYRIINIVIIAFIIYAFCFPLIADVLEDIMPGITKCVYLQITNKPCPLCGATRFMRRIESGNIEIKELVSFFGILSMEVIIELVFRIKNVFRKNYNSRLIKLDVLIHLVLVNLFILYEIIFIKFLS